MLFLLPKGIEFHAYFGYSYYMKRIIFLLFFLILCGLFVSTQEIITAERYLETVGERYGSIRDYEANVVITSGSSNEMHGRLSHLAPSLLKIEFTRPANQYILFTGDGLTVYLPEYRLTLKQDIAQSKRSSAAGANLVSSQGLILLKRNYTPSYVTGPDPVPLDSLSAEKVVKIRLNRRSVSEGFREIILSINPETKLIRRLEGRTTAETQVQFDFSNIRINQGITAESFISSFEQTTKAADSNIINNFLFKEND